MKEKTTTNNISSIDYISSSDYAVKTPNYVGGYRLGADHYFQFNLTHKPNWFHRTMMRFFFDMNWFDN